MARILVSATGGPLADVEVTFLHNDAAGSPVAATNAAGAVKWSRGYQPYGEFSSQTGATTDTRQFFHGKPLDGESGLQYFGARYYDPLLGRFMAIDPVPWNETNLHSFNRYAFANNNPTRFTDPDGNSPVDLLFLAYDLGKLGYAIYRGDGVNDAAIDSRAPYHLGRTSQPPEIHPITRADGSAQGADRHETDHSAFRRGADPLCIICCDGAKRRWWDAH